MRGREMGFVAMPMPRCASDPAGCRSLGGVTLTRGVALCVATGRATWALAKRLLLALEAQNDRLS